MKKLSLLMMLSFVVTGNIQAEFNSADQMKYAKFLLKANKRCAELAMTRKQRNPSAETIKDELEMCKEITSWLKLSLANLNEFVEEAKSTPANEDKPTIMFENISRARLQQYSIMYDSISKQSDKHIQK